MRANQWKKGVIVGILALMSAWLMALIWGLVDKTELAVSEAHRVEQQFSTLEGRKAVLEGNMAALGTARGQDTAIRTSFGVARPGEEVIIVVPPAVATTTPQLTWWQKVLQWF